MAKIAHELERALADRAGGGGHGALRGRVLAQGDAWVVEDVICTCGPRDRPFEERHAWFSIAVVVAGTFEYDGDCRSGRAPALMTPGSLFLGNAGDYFECAHRHAAGDRCVSFRYAPDHFARLAEDLGLRPPDARFRRLRLPPDAVLSPIVARSCAALLRSGPADWEALSLEAAGCALNVASGTRSRPHPPAREAVARVTAAVRWIERRPDAALTLAALARAAGLSPYHFLRVFERVTGVTPHQFVLRARLREAALRLAVEPSKIVDVALASGFGDVSNFNRSFREEFGEAPRAFRARFGGS